MNERVGFSRGLLAGFALGFTFGALLLTVGLLAVMGAN